MFILDNKPFRDKYRIVLQRPVTEIYMNITDTQSEQIPTPENVNLSFECPLMQ